MDPSPACPRVALGSAPLPRHISTFSASSEDLARPCMEGSSYNRLVPHQQNIILPLPHREGWGGSWGSLVGSVPQKNFTSLSACCWAGESSYRQGSVLAWKQSWTWITRRMTICQHCQDKTTMMMDVLNVLLLLRFCFYNILIINSVVLCLSVSVLLL